jgi:integral membrane protein
MIPLVRLTGFVEGLSALALYFIAMPMKHIWQTIDKDTFYTVGMAHGVLFTLYALIVTAAVLMRALPWKWWWILAAASIVPFGTFWADAKLKRLQTPASY